MSLFQNTIQRKINFSGIGLHSGNSVEIKLLPFDVNKGIFFNYKQKIIPALWNYAEVSQLCTKIKSKKIYISTIEHLMSALSGLGITNLLIDITNDELPILDGSAKDYINVIKKNGIFNQNKKTKKLKIKKKISISLNDKFISIEPSTKNKLIIDYTIDYKNKFIKKQKLVYEHDENNYLSIYKARTFCLQKDLEKIFSLGLGKGGSLDNAIVVSENKILNQGGLRYPDEFVRHKILDCIGDLYLAGYPIIGKVKCISGGHELNIMLLREIFSSNKNYEIIY